MRALSAMLTVVALAVAGVAHAGTRQAIEIRKAYAGEMRELSLRNRAALRDAHDAGQLTVVADLASAHNIRLRLDGRHPIGELDLANQELYLAARPETIGCLLQVASRVQSAPLEVTSLVRHAGYQRALARRNANARTQVPTHAMGLAFDISILHAPPGTAAEIRDVLEHMAAAGDLFFIAEQQQLVFHVVPTPGRRDYHAAVAHVLATIGLPEVAPPAPADAWLRAPRDVPPPQDDLAVAGFGGPGGRDWLEWSSVILGAVLFLAATARLARTSKPHA